MTVYESLLDHLAEVAVDLYHEVLCAHHARLGTDPANAEDDAAHLFAGSDVDVYEPLEALDYRYGCEPMASCRSAITEYLLVRDPDPRDPVLVRDEGAGLMMFARSGEVPQPLDAARVASHMDAGWPAHQLIGVPHKAFHHPRRCARPPVRRTRR